MTAGGSRGLLGRLEKHPLAEQPAYSELWGLSFPFVCNCLQSLRDIFQLGRFL